jgi:RNA polymerase sigma-70 factor (ECF subfamily)
MIEGKPGFTELMRRVREGSQDALSELVEDYQHHILMAVRRQLSKRLRSKFDSVDFQQAVWVSFFAHRSQFENFTCPEELIGFLTSMARNKVINEYRRRLATAKHNINVERPLDTPLGRAHPARQPTASQVAIANERLTRMMQQQPSHYREMVALRREGNTNKEIAERLGLNEKTVRRFFDKLASEQLK